MKAPLDPLHHIEASAKALEDVPIDEFEWIGPFLASEDDIDERLDVAIEVATHVINGSVIGELATSQETVLPADLNKSRLFKTRRSILVVRSAIDILADDDEPEVIGALSRAIGEFKDSDTRSGWDALKESARAVHESDQTTRELLGLRPVDPYTQNNRVLKFLDRAVRLSDSSELTDAQFHTMRKSLRKLTHLAQLEAHVQGAVTDPLRTYRFLWKITNFVGAQRIALQADQDGAKIEMTDEIQEMIAAAEENILASR